MRLFFTALHNENELRSFSYKPNTLEEGLDFLNFVAVQGDVLLNAHLVDEFSAMELPLEILDGHPFSAPIKSLEQEWQALLNQPVCSPPIIDHELVEWTVKRINICETKLDSQLSTIDRLEVLCQRAQKNMLFEPGRTRLIDHYKAQITIYTKQVMQLQENHKRLEQRLNQLLAS